MSIFVSPTEPPRLRDSFTVSLSHTEKYGCDLLVIGGKHRIGIQRKKFPNDFLTSLADGRLYQQLAMMGKLKQAALILEGYGKWSSSGQLISDDYSRVTIPQIYGLFFTLAWEFGVIPFWVRDLAATAEVVELMERWAKKEKHTSLKTRPKMAKDAWGRKDSKAFGLHVLQSFPRIGPDAAEKILEANGGFVPLVWTMTYEEFLAIDGIGKVTAEGLMEAL